MNSEKSLSVEQYRPIENGLIIDRSSTNNEANMDEHRNELNDDQTESNQLNSSKDEMDRKKSKLTTDNMADEVKSQSTAKNSKRLDYLIWEDYFMSVALLSAQRSKDPCTQVGACIVNDDHKIVSIGYNGMPVNCNDDLLPWSKGSDNELENKYLYVCHAELNAVLNCNTASLKDCTIYTTHFPCNECAKVIIQAGIRKIYYLLSKGEEKAGYIASKRLLNMANVKLIHYKPKEQVVVLNLAVQDK